jgi:hypothetical protein
MATSNVAVCGVETGENMFRRARYQQGMISRVKRRQGPDCWIFRWREPDASGKRVRRKVVLGTVEQYPTVSSALKAAESLRITINGEQPQSSQQPVSVGALVDHFKQHELSPVAGAEDEEEGRAYSTRSPTSTFSIFMWLPSGAIRSCTRYELSPLKSGSAS